MTPRIIELARAVEDSASGHGSSNAPVSRFATEAAERIHALEGQVADLRQQLLDVMEANGLWSGR